MEPKIEYLQKERECLRHRAAYWKRMTSQLKSSYEDQIVDDIVKQQKQSLKLAEEIGQLVQDNADLQQMVDEAMKPNHKLVTFCDGKYTDNVRACCYELLSLNVGVNNVVPIIKTVLQSFTDKVLDRMPSKTLLCNMMIECLTLAQAQLGEELTIDDTGSFTIQTDGTTKYGQHYGTYDIATSGESYVLGLRHVFSGAAQDTLDTLKEILEDLDIVHRELGCTEVSSMIVSKLKNTMSDRHAAEKLFNQMLSEYRADILQMFLLVGLSLVIKKKNK